LGKVIRDGRDVNPASVVNGWAWHNKKHAGEQSASDRLLYTNAEEDARSQRRWPVIQSACHCTLGLS